jgi:hypothetical protein
MANNHPDVKGFFLNLQNALEIPTFSLDNKNLGSSVTDMINNDSSHQIYAVQISDYDNEKI